jgi:Uma2 family endonuclease
MLPLKKQIYTLEEYLELDHESEEKIEFWDGHIWAIENSYSVYSRIIGNLLFEIGKVKRQKNNSIQFFPGMRVKVPAYPPYRYPDLSALCGEAEFEKLGKQEIFLNPNLIVEILSDSTAEFDRGYKFTYYKSIESFTEYLLIAQDRPHVWQFVKQSDNSWLNHEFSALGDKFRVASLDCELDLSELYQDVVFPENILPFQIKEI